MEVVIAGAGIGGLAAALFLNARGFAIRLFDAAPELRELGVGINIQPQAMAELARIQLAEEVAGAGNAIEEWALFNRFGQGIWREPRGRAAGELQPQVAISRGRLQGVLLAAVRQRLGRQAVLTAHRFVRFSEQGDRVQSIFLTESGETAASSDLLIGADGIHSSLRRLLYPGEGPPVYGGSVLWRGVTRMAPFLGGRSMALAGYRGRKFIAYPITPADHDGKAIVNWVADVAAANGLDRQDWNRTGRLESFLPLFEDWQFEWLDVPGVIRDAVGVYEYPMVDRDPLPRWSFGRVTLLGDAAHPMYPIGSNGASQAIRDAGALADALAADHDPVRALARYDDDRREATGKIVLSNRGLGPETVMNLAHERAPNGFQHIYDVIPPEELEAASRSYRHLTAGARPKDPFGG